MKKINDYLKLIFDIPEKYAYSIAIAGFIILAFGLRGGIKVFEILAYPVSTYSFVVLIVALTKTIPRIVQYIINSELWGMLSRVPLLGLLITNTRIRMRFFLYFGTLMNIFYVVLKISSGIIYSSLWLSFFGGYYLVLAILRAFIIHFERKYDENSNLPLEYKRYMSCGIVLFVLDAVLVYIIYLAANFKAVLDYPGVLIYGMAFYSFYSIILATYNIFRNRKHERLMFGAARIASFTSALVSMLSLEIAMMARFGADDIVMRKEMTVWTGTAVFLLVIYMAIMMIIKGYKGWRMMI